MPNAPQQSGFTFEIPAPKRCHIERFQALYEQRHGVALSNTEAVDKLTALLVIVRYRQYEEELSRFLKSQSVIPHSIQIKQPPKPQPSCHHFATSNTPVAAVKNAPTSN